MLEQRKAVQVSMTAFLAIAAACGGAQESANTETAAAEESNAAAIEEVRAAADGLRVLNA